MDINLINNTKTLNTFMTPTLIWCFIMPLIHFLSLISNILCIIVFCSKTFIKKPIAIYFICLLISDSTTLLIGYSEMIDRESSMVDKSSLLCMFNEKIIHGITDVIYTFMGKFCLEWMLYKVLWTRASTILLAILSIQRSRTFFSLSYHETRFCALFACIMSILIAVLITCFEWTGVQCEKSTDSYIYIEMFQLIKSKQFPREFYSNFLYENYDQSVEKYYCIVQSLDIHRFNNTILETNQFNCSITNISSEFYSLTQSLLSSRDLHISESITHILTSMSDYNVNTTNTSLLIEHIQQAKSTEILIKLFEERSCQLTLRYSLCLKLFNFLHSLSFSFNRHTLAIFFGNALPSFIVFSANLLSLKVIYFSKSLKYLNQITQQNRRKRRLKNDLRAFLVILIESFSVITISWGIPIFLTMYHCRTLYVVSIASCPQIKTSLAIFLFTDLFNSSTNCLLYSLSGKLFRRRFILIIKTIFTCGRNVLWNVKRDTSFSRIQQMELQQSNDASTNLNHCIHSRTDSYRHTDLHTTKQMKKLQNLSSNKKLSDDDGSLSIVKISDDADTESIRKFQSPDKIKKRQTIKIFFTKKVPLFKSTKNPKLIKANVERRPFKNTNPSYSSSSGTGSNGNGSQKKLSNNQSYSSKVVLINTDDNQSMKTEKRLESVTSL